MSSPVSSYSKKLPAREGRWQTLIAPTEPIPPRAVINGHEDRVTRNIAGNADNGLTVEPRSDRNQGHIFVLYTNARSLIPKIDELLAYIATEEHDFITITETLGEL